MRKVLIIAAREYRAMVGTKAFLLSIVMMPILMLGGLFATELLKDVGDIKERKIAIIDQTGKLYDILEERANQRNELVRKGIESIDDLVDSAKKSQDEQDEESEEKDDEPQVFGPSKDIYVLERIEPEEVDDQLRVDLSDRVRQQDLYAFIEIPPKSLERIVLEDDAIRYYSQDSGLSEARQFFSRLINEEVKTMRFQEMDLDPEKIRLASIPVRVRGLGLVSKAADGQVNSAEEADTMKAIFLPMGVMMMMFMVIFMASQPMLESVLEEKSQRIAEVLLGSANPMQLMTGKLLGTVGGSLTVFGIYLIGAYLLAVYKGWTGNIPFHLAPWFLVFQVVGVLFYAAIFMAVGASVSQLKEAQSMLLPVWMMLMLPMFIWIFIVRDPLGPMATGFSLFPPATPTTMILRMATGVTIPVWQPVVGLVITLVCTVFIVFLASRIFRVGILWQGKTPKVGEIIKWAFSSQ